MKSTRRRRRTTQAHKVNEVDVRTFKESAAWTIRYNIRESLKTPLARGVFRDSHIYCEIVARYLSSVLVKN